MSEQNNSSQYMGLDAPTGKKYDNQSYNQSKYLLSSAEKFVGQGNTDEAKNALKNFAIFSGLEAPELKKGVFGGSKVKQNMLAIRNLSDTYNMTTLNRYREESYRKGNYFNSDQYEKLWRKSREASVNSEAAFETSAYLEEVLSRAKRSDDITGLTDVALTKLDAIKSKYSDSETNINNTIEEFIKDMKESRTSGKLGTAVKNEVGGVVSNFTSMADMVGHLYSFVSGNENPIQATNWLANKMDLDLSSWSFNTGMLAGFTLTGPIFAGATAAMRGANLETISGVLSKSLANLATRRKIIGTGFQLAAMHFAPQATAKILDEIDIITNKNRKEALPHLSGLAAGIYGHKLIESSVIPSEADIYRSNNKLNPENPLGEGVGNKPQDRMSVGKQTIRESLSNGFKVTKELENEVSSYKEPTPNATASESPIKNEKIQTIKKTPGKSFQGSAIVNNEITELNPSNMKNGAENSANYNRKVKADGRLQEFDIDPISKAIALNEKAQEVVSNNINDVTNRHLTDSFVENGNIKGLEESSEAIYNAVNELPVSENVSRFASHDSTSLSDKIRSVSGDIVIPEVQDMLLNFADARNQLLRAAAQERTSLGRLVKEILKTESNARTKTAFDVAGINLEEIDMSRINDSEYIFNIVDNGIEEITYHINERFNNEYSEFVGEAVDFYSENPEMLSSVSESILNYMKKLSGEVVSGPEGSKYKYSKHMLKIARALDFSTPEGMYEGIADALNIQKNGSENVIRNIIRIKNAVYNSVGSAKTRSAKNTQAIGDNASFNSSYNNPIKQIVRSIFKQALTEEQLNRYEEVNTEYSKVMNDKSELNADRLNTAENKYNTIARKNPELINKYLSHMKDTEIRPGTDISKMQQTISAIPMESLLDIETDGTFKLHEGKSINDIIKKNRNAFEKVLSKKQMSDLSHVAQLQDQAMKSKINVEQIVKEGKLSGKTDEQISNSIKDKFIDGTARSIASITSSGVKAIKKINILPIGNISAIALAVKTFIVMFEKISEQNVNSIIKSLTDDIVKIEAHPHIKGLSYYNMSKSIIRDGGFGESNINK